ncbi:hypothetical protein ACLKA6_012859 [Drosophila palustris]
MHFFNYLQASMPAKKYYNDDGQTENNISSSSRSSSSSSIHSGAGHRSCSQNPIAIWVAIARRGGRQSATRGILHLMDMLSMRQLNGFCCPSWATGSHQHQHQHQLEQKQRQRQQQHAAAASTTTANLANTRTITVATAAVPDAYGRICSTAAVGHNTLDAHLGHFHFTIVNNNATFALAMAKAATTQHKHSH